MNFPARRGLGGRRLRRMWYPIIIAFILLLEFMRLLETHTPLEEWVVWAAIAAAGIVSIRFRVGGLLALCGVFLAVTVSPISASCGIELTFFAVGYLCATAPIFLGVGAAVVLGVATGYGSYLVDSTWDSAIYMSISFLVPVAVGLAIANYRHLYEAEQAKSHLELVRQSQNLSIKVHDSISHVLVQISILSGAESSNDKEPTLNHLQQINELAARGLREMRSLVNELQSQAQQSSEPAGARDYLGGTQEELESSRNAELGVALQDLAVALQRAGFELELQIQGDTGLISDSKSAVLSDCLREITTNILKHGIASQPVVLLLWISEGRVKLFCANEAKARGRDFPSSGLGLKGIRHRVEARGGRMETSLDSGTWSITVEV